jgi:hypothetical protein
MKFFAASVTTHATVVLRNNNALLAKCSSWYDRSKAIESWLLLTSLLLLSQRMLLQGFVITIHFWRKVDAGMFTRERLSQG